MVWAQWVCVLMHSAGLGRLGKALGERAVTEELDSLGLITPRRSLPRILSLDCECSYKVIDVFAFC